MENNYAELGLTFVSEDVAKQNGDNRTDKVTFNRKARIAIVTDLTKFTAAFGEDSVLGMLDGQGLRVPSQAVNRAMLAKGAKDAEIETAIINRIKGVRNAGARGTTTVVKFALPNGEFYTGTDEVEYQQAYTLALVEAGVPANIATGIASNQKLTK
jgi:hypothetical protein